MYIYIYIYTHIYLYVYLRIFCVFMYLCILPIRIYVFWSLSVRELVKSLQKYLKHDFLSLLDS